MLTQGIADIEVLTGDFDLHGRRKYPCFALLLHMGAFVWHVNWPVPLARETRLRCFAVVRKPGPSVQSPAVTKRAEPSRGRWPRQTLLDSLYARLAATLDG